MIQKDKELERKFGGGREGKEEGREGREGGGKNVVLLLLLKLVL